MNRRPGSSADFFLSYPFHFLRVKIKEKKNVVDNVYFEYLEKFVLSLIGVKILIKALLRNFDRKFIALSGK